MRQIINSILDTDHYKLTMASVVFHNFPRAIVEYEFINRGHTPFPVGFSEKLQEQINLMQSLALTPGEENWLKTIPYIRPTFIEWFRGYRYNPLEVKIIENCGGILFIRIEGPWYRTIFWEVPLMAIISELYFEMTNQKPQINIIENITRKAEKLSDNKCHWIDFGTRRRYSYEVQQRVVEIMHQYNGFLGTSNPHFAHKFGITPHGTYAHEAVMAMSALYGPRMSNKMWMKHWAEHFEGNVGVALTDTFTTDVFLQDFGTYETRLFDGVRQDSNDPYKWGRKVLNHYKKLNIPTSNKRLVFSDALTTDKYIALDEMFRGEAQPIGGIGTHFTNDVGTDVKPLNIVIKMTSANFGNGFIDVVKLSDDSGKHTGKPDAIRKVKEQLEIL